MRKLLILLAAVAGSGASFISSAAQAKWNPGTYQVGDLDFLNSSNWVGGVVDDFIDSDVALDSAGNNHFFFTADHATGANGLRLHYVNGPPNFNPRMGLRSSGGTRTLTLNGPFSWTIGSSRDMNVGDAGALNINLGGGQRTFTAARPSNIIVWNDISNGGVTFNGQHDLPTGQITTMEIRGATTYAGDTIVNTNVVGENRPVYRVVGTTGSISGSGRLFANGGILQIGEGGGASQSNTNRVGDSAGIYTDGGTLKFLHGSATASSVTENTGSFYLGKRSTIEINNSSGSQSLIVQADSLERVNRGTGVLAGNYGSATSQLKFDTAPLSIGTSTTAGTTNLKVVPFLYAGVATTNGESSSPELVTYGSNGARALTASEYVTSTVAANTTANFPAASADDNVKLNLGSNAISRLNGDTTVNALLMNMVGQAELQQNVASKLTVTSGSIVVSKTNTTNSITINELAFGSAEGFVSVTNAVGGFSDALVLQTNITGSNGVTFSAVDRSVFSSQSHAGRIILNTTSAYTGPTTITGGRFELRGAERISNSSAVTVHRDAQFYIDNNGTETVASLAGTGAAVLGTNSTLMLGTGAGTTTANAVNLNSGGAISPGHSPGTFSITGNFISNAGGNLNIELASATSYDVLAVSGNATINGGNLNVTLLDGYPAPLWSTYTILTAASVTDPNGGMLFNSISAHPNSAVFFQTSIVGGNTIVLSVLPEPSCGLIIAGLSGLMMIRRRRSC